MAWTITNGENNIEFDNGEIKRAIDKTAMDIYHGTTTAYVMVHNTIDPDHSINKLEIKYTDVTTPAFGTAIELYDQLMAWKNEPSNVITTVDTAGLATEPKQDDAITLLTAIDADTSKLNVDLSTRASEAKQDTQITNQGTEGATPPTIPGTGIIGYLRSIYDRLLNIASLTFTGDDLNVTAADKPGVTSQIISTVNVTEVPLGIGATYTGTFEDNEAQGVMVHVETDQAGVLYFDFDQQTSGTNIDTFPFSGFSHTASIPSFHVALKGRQLFRVRFENTSGSAQTFLRISTYFGEYREPNTPLGLTLNDDTDAIVTHSVLTGKDKTGVYRNVNSTPSGNLQVSLIDSQTGSGQIVDLNGAAKFGEAIILAGDVFGNNTPNALQWDEEFVGSGAIVNEAGSLRVETSTTANSEVRFQSIKKARFMLSQFNIFHCGLQLDNLADANCERRFGVFDPINATQNGAYFALIDGAWNVGYCKDGAETLIPQANWNGTNKDLFNDSTALSPYEIHYNAGSIFFFQRGNFLHKVAGLPDPYASEYNFKVAVEVINKNGNTTNNGIDLYALGVYRLGEERGEPISRVFDADTLIKESAGYISNAYLSRTGSGGGSAALIVYDGIDNTGFVMARVDIGADDVKGIPVNSTFSDGLYIEVSGTGTVNATIAYE